MNMNMNMNKVIFFVFTTMLLNISINNIGMAVGSGEGSIIKENIKNLQFVYLPDNRLPTYEIVFYFADGALSDEVGSNGETSSMITLLTSGTKRYKQEEISDFLEFYGAGIGGNVTHEYTYFVVGGLAKDLVPTVKMICHLFSQSVFPEDELNKLKIRSKTAIENIISSPSALTDRVFREVSLRETPYQKSAEISLQGIKNLNQKVLNKKLQYFRNIVKKRIYISSPKDAYLEAKKIISKDCAFNLSKSNFVRKINSADAQQKNLQSYKDSKVFLVPMVNSTQAQIRVGRYLASEDVDDIDLLHVGSEILGGSGFGSMLMQELREKRGLTYGASAFATPQRDYGRSMISTFTKTETTNEAIEVIKNVLAKLSQGDYEDSELQKRIKYLKGKHPFGFERRSSYLKQLIYFDHIGRDYKYIYSFPDLIGKFSKEDVSKQMKKIFPWEKQVILVTGNPSLESELTKKWGKVVILDYKNFL
ncbi:MAG: insulinase family protein [Oligoflexia bacterium]|nr:insulinase family protein [Oligoflexia bacterium]